MVSGAREAGCFREVAALHSDHLRQVPLYVRMYEIYGWCMSDNQHTFFFIVLYDCIIMNFVFSAATEEAKGLMESDAQVGRYSTLAIETNTYIHTAVALSLCQLLVVAHIRLAIYSRTHH